MNIKKTLTGIALVLSVLYANGCQPPKFEKITIKGTTIPNSERYTPNPGGFLEGSRYRFKINSEYGIKTIDVADGFYGQNDKEYIDDLITKDGDQIVTITCLSDFLKNDIVLAFAPEISVGPNRKAQWKLAEDLYFNPECTPTQFDTFCLDNGLNPEATKDSILNYNYRK